MPEDRNFLFVLSPNAGILDSWLPVLDRLAKSPQVKIHAILPRPRATLNLRGGDSMIRNSAKTFASVHFCMADARWARARNLVQARQKLVLANWKRRLFRISRTSQTVEHQDDPVVDHETIRVHLEKSGLQYPEAMLCDVSETHKPYFWGLIQAVPQTRIHSVSQAVSLQDIGVKHSAPSQPTLPRQVRDRIETQFLLSESEQSHYRSNYGLSDTQLSVSGIFRHDPQWITRLRPRTGPHGLEPGSYVFLASRPTNPRYLPLSEKQRVLVMAHEQARKRGLTLVIRRHPFEGNRREFERFLGKPGKRNHWLETVRHSMDIGFGCALAITLNSSVAIDLAAMGVPVIDPIDYSKLRDDSPSIRFDGLRRPIGMFCNSGVAVEASDEESFSAAVDRLWRQAPPSRVQPSKAYRTLYADPTGCIQRSTDRILDSVEP